MKDNKREPLLTRLAKQYLEEEGRRLQEEAERLEAEAATPMPAMDGKVKSFRAARRRGRYVAAFSAVAAGLLLIFLLPRLEMMSPASEAPLSAQVAKTDTLQTQAPEAVEAAKGGAMTDEADGSVAAPDTLFMEPTQRAASAAEDAAPQAPAAAAVMEDAAFDMEAEDAAPQSPLGAAPAAAAPLEEASGMSPRQDALGLYAAPEGMAKSAAPASGILPLSFALPDGFTVDSVRQDRGETIYQLANAELDDVVLSVAEADDAPLATDGLVVVRGEAGDTAYGLAGADVQFLTFEQDGLRYRLTCHHDIQTLLSLWQHIVSA